MTNTIDSHHSLFSYLVLTLKGFCMGSADVVPGVSGGTMAFILGIYEELIKAIRSFDLNFLKLILSLKMKDAMNHASWQFLTAVGLGILIAIFSLARILSWLLQNQPILIWSFFFGLILASVYTVSRKLNQWNLFIPLWMLLGAAGAYLLVGMVPVSTPDAPWFLFISGAVAICAMILPGISGAFILVLMGKYHFVLEAVNNHDLFTLMVVAAGACVGLIAFSRFLNWILKKHHVMTIAILTGLMLGSLRKIWPWKETVKNMAERGEEIVILSQVNILPSQWNNEVMVSIGLMVMGFLVVFFMNLLAEQQN